MTQTLPVAIADSIQPEYNEKSSVCTLEEEESANPVIEGTEFAYQRTNLVHISEQGVNAAAQYIQEKLRTEHYSPRTWRTHPLHICPNEPHSSSDPWNKNVLNWIFLISSLNFSFWSELEGTSERYGVDWQTSWTCPDRKTYTGYWSLVAALNRAMEDDDLPITSPDFYSSEILCPDSLIEHIFRAAPTSRETIPLLKERIEIMRQNGSILCSSFGGSFQGFLDEFQRLHDGQGTALDLVKMITETFPSFRDEVYLEGRKVCIWKRAQILVAETWAAFFPQSPESPHPLFPGSAGPEIHQLTMFADYRVPQILHHLNIISYPPSLVKLLREGAMLAPGCREEISLRAASIVAVERVRDQIVRMQGETCVRVSSVLIDFFLWDLAKKLERGEEKIEGLDTAEMIPIHRTRSIWY